LRQHRRFLPARLSQSAFDLRAKIGGRICGFLTVSLLNSFVPSVSEKFLFLTYAGTLNADNFFLTNANVDPNGIFTVDYATPGDVYLDFTATNAAATPEPGFIYPVFGILAGLLGYRKMKKNQRTRASDGESC
jgi:hypothetical protein